MTDADGHRGTRSELLALEPIFHRSPDGSGRDVFEQMTMPDFWEVGASGRVYGREAVLDTVVERYARGEDPGPSSVSDFSVREAGTGTWLATYELEHRGRRSRRATLWTRTALGWRAIYHQGTAVDSD